MDLSWIPAEKIGIGKDARDIVRRLLADGRWGSEPDAGLWPADLTLDALVPSRVRLLERHGEATRERQVRQQLVERSFRADWLYCARCGAVITHAGEAISIGGQHSHHCVNPHGIAFHVGCFRTAPGCAQAGDESAEHTWFAGYVWRVAVCAACQRQLGWRFCAADSHFYGLILNRLTPRGPGPGA